MPMDHAPTREINLKVGMPVLLTDPIFIKGGLVNGTRLIVTSIYDGFLKAKLTSGTFKGDEVVIHKMWWLVLPGDSNTQAYLLFQYPLIAGYAVAFNFYVYDPVKISGVFLSGVYVFLKPHRYVPV